MGGSRADCLTECPTIGFRAGVHNTSTVVRTSSSPWSIRNQTSTAGGELQASKWGFIYTIAAPLHSLITPRRDTLACFPGTVCSYITYVYGWEDEMAGWHHWLNGCESEWTSGVSDGQGGLVCCDSWDRKIRYNWVTELNWRPQNNSLVNSNFFSIWLWLDSDFLAYLKL